MYVFEQILDLNPVRTYYFQILCHPFCRVVVYRSMKAKVPFNTTIVKKTVLKSLNKLKVEKPHTELENRCTGEGIFRARNAD